MKILVIRRDNIGDLICTTPMLYLLRQKFPDARICVLANTYNKDVLAGNDDIDHIFEYTKLKHKQAGQSLLGLIWKKISLYWELYREKFDYVICAGAGYSENSVRLAKKAHGKHVISYVHEGRSYDPVVNVPVVKDDSLCEHEAIRVARLLQPLGIEPLPGKQRLWLDRGLRADIQGLLQPALPVLAIHISARDKPRIWPFEFYLDFIDRMLKHGWQVLLLWAPGASNDPRHPGDDVNAAKLLKEFEGQAVVGCRTDDLKRLAAAFSIAELALCSEGGASHMVAAVGTPIVGLFEHLVKKYGYWYPWAVPSRVLTSNDELHTEVRYISVDRVEQACLELHEEQKGQVRDEPLLY